MESTNKSTTAAPAPNYSSTNVRDRVSSMLQAGWWTDCKFLVGTEHQELVEGHKLILASASPVFNAMFFGEMAESQTPIPIPDINPATFKAMLEYIYTDDVKLRSFDEAPNLYYAANKYILPNLENICITYVESILTKENVCQAYEFASMFEEKYLMGKCTDFIENNRKEFLENYLWYNLENIKLSTLVAIFSLETMKHCNALYFSDVTERYAKILKKQMKISTNCKTDCESSSQKSSECSMVNDMVVVNEKHIAEDSKEASEKSMGEEKGIAPTPTGSKKKPNVRPLLEKIHFLKLTPQQFAEGPAISGLLTESEAYAIIMNIVSDKTKILMPRGFSTYRGKESKRCENRVTHKRLKVKLDF